MSRTTTDEILSAYPMNKWVIWVGAGVSCAPPTNLPLGIPLTQFVLSHACSPEVSVRLTRIWDKSNEICSDDGNPQPFGAAPRLETVLGVVDNAESISPELAYDFMSGFTAFDDAPYNSNHLCLAKLLSDGASIVTTNFDSCIQNAFTDEIRPGIALQREKVENAYRFRCPEVETGALWHIHGAAIDISGLGATIRNVKRGLPNQFTIELKSLLSDGCLLMFLGYSASDSFDVNLFFSRLRTREYQNSTAVFFQHETASLPANADILLKPFGERIKEFVDTGKTLHSISGHRDPRVQAPVFEWNGAFLDSTDLGAGSKIKGYLTCRLARELGLSFRLLDSNAYGLAMKNRDLFDNWELHRTLASNCRMIGKSKKEQLHDHSARDYDLLGYSYSQGDLKAAKKPAKSIDVLLEESKDPMSELDWDTYTPMSAHCRPIINKYLINPLLRRVEEPDRRDVENLMKLVTQLGDRPLRNVVHLNQVATAWRFATLFRALLGGDQDLETERNILSLYAEASSIQGFVSAYRDFAIKRILLNKLHCQRISAGNIYGLARRSRKLAKLIGDVWGARRAMYVIVLLFAHKVIPCKRSVGAESR